MNRLDRLAAILIQLQSKRIVKAQEISERFEITLRTVYRDIKALQEAGIPIGVEPGKGYFIVDGYFLPPVMFTKEEASALLMGGKLIEKMADESIRKEFFSALYKIKSVLKTNDKEHLELLEDNIMVQKWFLAESESNKFIVPVQEAIAGKNVIEIEYYTYYRDKISEREVDPIGIVHYAGAWHLIAFCRMREDYRDFRIDRIRRIKKTNKNFRLRNRKSLKEYIDEQYKDVELQKIVIKVPSDIYKVMLNSKYFYGYVSEIRSGDFVEVTFMYGSLEYFARWLLSYTNGIEIIKPAELKTEIIKFINELSSHYCN